MSIIEVISPLILVALTGFIASNSRWLLQPQLQALSKFTFNLSIPAFLFKQMATAQFPADFSLNFFVAFYLPVLSCYVLAAALSYNQKHQHHKQQGAAGVFALGSSYSNTIIVGLPILLMTYGDNTLPLIFMIVSFHSAMLFALTTLLATKNKRQNWLKFAIGVINNPLILSIFLGLIVNLVGVELPRIMLDSLQLLGQPAIACALFTLGASLAYYKVKSEWRLVVLATGLKLLLLPILVLFSARYLFALDQLTVKTLVILSACPTGVNAYLMAQNYQFHRQAIASTVFISTVLATITLPMWLLVLA